MPHDPSFDSNALVVGTDTDYEVQGDAYDNSAVKIEPSAGQIAQGLMRPGKQVGAQHFNWLMSQFGLVLQALISNDVGHEQRLDTDEAELADHESRVVSIENYITNLSPRIRIYPFLANGTLRVPPRCVAAFSYGCGGGGAGGGGHLGVNAIDSRIAGGAGGGGALATLLPLLNLVPDEILNVDVGLGGAILVNGIGSTGNDGGDSIVRRGTVGLAVHSGAQGGRGSVGGHVTGGWIHYTMGGMPVRGQQTMLLGPAGQGIRWDSSANGPYGVGWVGDGTHSLYLMQQPGQGGHGAGGVTNPTSGAGARNLTGGFAGGAPGPKGNDGDDNAPPGTVARRGGGGGGGGGAGPWGPGGVGGFGDAGETDYNNWGGTAPANSGAGGGGCGSTGYQDGANYPSCAGAYGGGGGSGRVYIITIEESP